MSSEGWRTVLVLGGIRSGKSGFAESLVGDEKTVRYVATGTVGEDDPEWAERIEAHRQRRPEAWTTDEIGAEPGRLAELVSAAGPDETLLVDDLGGWVTALLDGATGGDEISDAAVTELAGALADCRARVIVVSPEVGLSLVPTTAVGRAFADTVGTANRAVAEACDAVVLVVAGQPTWLKHQVAKPREEPLPEVLTPTAPATPVPAAPAAPTAPVPAPAASDALSSPTMVLPMVATGLVIQPNMDLPMPDEYAGPAATDRLATLDVPGAGLGALDRVVAFAAATQGTSTPAPWQAVRVLLLHGDHDGGAAEGEPAGESARRADQARAGEGALARLAAAAGATLQVVDAPTAAPIEHGPALTVDAVEAALRRGWRLAEEAVDSGVDVIVLASCGIGTEAAAAAVLAATAGAEPAAVLSRVVAPGGRLDDLAWMRRCAAVRDAMHRTRDEPRGPKDVLAELGGGDIAIATGVLLGATARRTPVLLDGPVGVAAGLVSRDLAGQARHWCLLPDHGGQPAVRLGADVLGLTPVLDLRLDLGEGATALAALPLLRTSLALASGLPAHPELDA
ncbi:bifunctional adenosylcobinamide kinase/adenosylcobinamide-phosphate guanylyltransferase [Actinomycetes bacterium KLBMP 9797]